MIEETVLDDIMNKRQQSSHPKYVRIHSTKTKFYQMSFGSLMDKIGGALHAGIISDVSITPAGDGYEVQLYSVKDDDWKCFRAEPR